MWFQSVVKPRSIHRSLSVQGVKKQGYSCRLVPLVLTALFMFHQTVRSRWVAKMVHVCMQGDEEAKLQLPVTPMCDRRSVIVSTNQLRFIQFLLKVCYFVFNPGPNPSKTCHSVPCAIYLTVHEPISVLCELVIICHDHSQVLSLGHSLSLYLCQQ